jgi:hypothetical protein
MASRSISTIKVSTTRLPLILNLALPSLQGAVCEDGPSGTRERSAPRRPALAIHERLPKSLHPGRERGKREFPVPFLPFLVEMLW